MLLQCSSKRLAKHSVASSVKTLHGSGGTRRGSAAAMLSAGDHGGGSTLQVDGGVYSCLWVIILSLISKVYRNIFFQYAMQVEEPWRAWHGLLPCLFRVSQVVQILVCWDHSLYFENYIRGPLLAVGEIWRSMSQSGLSQLRPGSDSDTASTARIQPKYSPQILQLCFVALLASAMFA